MFKLLFVLLASLCVVYAAVSIGQLQPKPEKFKDQEGCYIDDLDEVIPFGASKSSKTSCMLYRCGTDFIDYVSCGAVFAVPPCTTKKSKEKPYPECCPQIVCP